MLQQIVRTSGMRRHSPQHDSCMQSVSSVSSETILCFRKTSAHVDRGLRKVLP
jgi:hypothetical protein